MARETDQIIRQGQEAAREAGQAFRQGQETGQIHRDIAETRREIDEHLTELSGRVRGELDVQTQARRNLPALLAGLAVAGLATGLVVGRGRRHHEEEPCAEREFMFRRIPGEYDIP